MRPADLLRVLARAEPVDGVLANRLEHRETVVVGARDQALVEQRRERVEVGAATASAASSVQPPMNTASRANSVRSSGSSRS